MRNCTSCGAAVTTRHKYCADCRDTASPWRPDEFNIERARIELGLKHPVVIRRSCGKNTSGKYLGINARGEHVITVAARLSPTMASQVIWHELTHAKQREQNEDFHFDYTLARARYGYANNVYEIEAKASEDNHYARFSLTHANKRANMRRVKNSLVLYAEDGEVFYTQKYYKYMSANANAIAVAKASLA